jgi:hypothetical protein
VKDALFASGAYGQGDAAPSSEDSALSLRRLNRLLDSWNTVRLMIYAIVNDQFTMSPSVGSYSSTLLANGRPTRIYTMTARLNNIDYDIDPTMTKYDFEALPYKIVTAPPNYCYVEYTYPNLTMNFFPVPDAAYTCFVGVPTKLPTTIAAATVLALPPGYERMLVDNLAVDLCPSFKITPSQDLRDSAKESMTLIKRINNVPLLLDSYLGSDSGSDISNGFVYRGF